MHIPAGQQFIDRIMQQAGDHLTDTHERDHDDHCDQKCQQHHADAYDLAENGARHQPVEFRHFIRCAAAVRDIAEQRIHPRKFRLTVRLDAGLCRRRRDGQPVRCFQLGSDQLFELVIVLCIGRIERQDRYAELLCKRIRIDLFAHALCHIHHVQNEDGSLLQPCKFREHEHTAFKLRRIDQHNGQVALTRPDKIGRDDLLIGITR